MALRVLSPAVRSNAGHLLAASVLAAQLLAGPAAGTRLPGASVTAADAAGPLLARTAPLASPAPGDRPAPVQAPRRGGGGPARPAPEPPKPKIDPEGWQELPIAGLRGIELTLEGRSRIEVRMERAAAGRLRARSLAPPGGVAGDSGGGGSARSVAMELELVRGILYITQDDEEATPGASGTKAVAPPGAKAGAASAAKAVAPSAEDSGVDIVLEIPSRLGLTILAEETAVTVRGDPLSIAADLEPYQAPARPPAPGSQPGPAGSVANQATGSRSLAGGTGGMLDLRATKGPVTVQDFLGSVSIEKKDGPVILQRLAGSVNVANGSGPVQAEALEGTLLIRGASGVRTRGARRTVEIRDTTGRVEIHGVGGDLRLTLQQQQLELEDARGRVEARLGEGSARIIGVMGPAILTTNGTDLTGERLQLGMEINSSGGGVRLREVNGPVTVRGAPDRVDVESTGGPVTVRGDPRDVRLRNIKTDVVVQITNGDVSVDKAEGRVTVTTQNGRAVLTGLIRPAQVNADSIDADMDPALDVSADYSYKAQRYVRLTIPEGKYNIKVQAQGDVRSDLPYEKVAVPGDPSAAGGSTGAPGGSRTGAGPGAPAASAGGPGSVPPGPAGGSPTGGGTGPGGAAGGIGPGTVGTGLRPQTRIPPPRPTTGGPRITIDCAGDVEIRQI